MIKTTIAYKHFPWEAAIWIVGLSFVATYHSSSHFSFCPLKNLGFSFCPGCGLGNSIYLLAHGYITSSLKAHPFGIFAVIILTFRITKLLTNYFQTYGKSN